MQTGVSISVLGPVEVRVDGIVQKCSGRQRDLLARLIVQRSERRPKTSLIADLYGDEPIRSADAAFRVVLAQLRKVFEPYQQVVLTGSLYGLDAETADLVVDVWQFADQCHDGQVQLQKGNHKEAAAVLETALELWRGTPYGGVTRIIEADEEAQRVTQLRVTAQEDFAEATLHLGGQTEIVDRLSTWVNENPERERLRSLHLLALYRSGRQVEAIRAIDELKEYFAEAGLIPTPTLARLCDDIFQQAPGLESNSTVPTRLPIPNATLPPILAAARRGFAGRDEVRRSLQLPLKDLVVLMGKPGIGKTALLGEIGKDLLRSSKSAATKPIASATPPPVVAAKKEFGADPETAIQRVVYCQCEPTEQTGLSPIRLGLGLVQLNPTQDWDLQINELLSIIDTHLESSGMALFVDDIQWADEPTMRFLRRLASRERKPNFAVICAGWSTEGTEAFCTLPTIRRIHLRPLTRTETELAAQAINIDFELHHELDGRKGLVESTYEQLWTISGGYPLLLRSVAIAYGLTPLLDDLTLAQRDNNADRKEVLPLVLQHLLKNLGTEGQHLARLASLIGMELDEEQLASVSGFELADVRKAVNGLIDIGIVDSSYPLRFRHRLIAEALTFTLEPSQLAALHSVLGSSDVLPLTERAKHSLKAGPLLPFAEAYLLAGMARTLAREDQLPDQLVELSEIERNVRLRIGAIDPKTDFELCTDLAFGNEALGNTRLGNRFRELALQIAEREGNFEWASVAVLTAPANGRAIAAGRSISQISRAINLAQPNSPTEALLQLRAERVHRLGISGATSNLSEQDLLELRKVEQHEVAPDSWIKITRARLCSDLAVASLDQRTAATCSLVEARTHCRDNDLCVDALVLIMRNALETHNIGHVDVVLGQIEQEFLSSLRPMDRWIRNVLRCAALAVRGQLGAAFSHAVEARRLGHLYGISDSAITWDLQSSQLLAYDPKLADLFDEDVPWESPMQESSGDETMDGNLLALGLALMAQSEVEQGNNASATAQISMAQQVLDQDSPDHYLAAAAGQIVRTCFALNTKPQVDLTELLHSVRTTSIIIGMIPGWSMGPALRYSALAEHLAGKSETAIQQLIECADYARDTTQHLWEYVCLDDILKIDRSIPEPQYSALVDRRRRVRNRFT